MSREIKFRGMTKANNVMVFGDLIVCPNGEHRMLWFELKGELPLDVDCNSFNEVVQSSTISQFTGLQDKNGVDIYEGDILEYKNDLYRHHLAKIFYKKGGLCFNIHEDDFYKNSEEIYFYESCADMQSKEWIVQFEIIGNIHEHPNLLK